MYISINPFYKFKIFFHDSINVDVVLLTANDQPVSDVRLNEYWLAFD